MKEEITDILNNMDNIWHLKYLISGMNVYICAAKGKMVMEKKDFDKLRTSDDFNKIRIIKEDKVVLPSGYKCILVDKLNEDTMVSLGLL